MSTNSSPTAIVLATAGLGTSDFLAAGKRIVRQSQGFKFFTDRKLLTTGNLPSLCPKVNGDYGEFLNSS